MSDHLSSPPDSQTPDCVWHRILFDGAVPPETQVGIWSRAANTEEELARQKSEQGVTLEVVAKLPGGATKDKSFKATEDLDILGCIVVVSFRNLIVSHIARFSCR